MVQASSLFHRDHMIGLKRKARKYQWPK
jgi:hypothetical protein